MTTAVPVELAGYLTELVRRLRDAVGDDLGGAWLTGSAAQGVYEHGVSDVDVLAVTRRRWPEAARRALGERIVHPALPCPTVGLEFVWYARDDLVDLADPVAFQLNVNGGTQRPSSVQLAPDGFPNYWSVLDLAAARQVGVPLEGARAASEVIPEVPAGRVRRAVDESITWHDGPDAGSPNRVLNLARMLVLATEGRWVSKPAGAAEVRARNPEFAGAIDEALRARAESRWMDPAYAESLSTAVRAALG